MSTRLHPVRVRGYALAIVLGACGGDTPTDPEAALFGNWIATKWEYINRANSSEKVDLIQQGARVTLLLTNGNVYSLTLSIPRQPDQNAVGTWVVQGSTLVITEEGSTQSDSLPFTVSNSNRTLSFTLPNVEWDFDDDGFDEPASLAARFTKQ